MSDLSNTQAPLPLHTVPPELLQFRLCKHILPAVTNEIITLVKDTSLAFVLAVTEMFTMAKQIAAAQTSMVPYIAAGIFYYVFNLLVAMIMEKIEEKLNYYH